MIAEDDAEDVVIFKAGLDEIKMPYIIRHAENGEVLFVLLKERIPYILFLDIHMPCKDGHACILEIRKNREYDKLPVIMYTSHSLKSSVETSFRNGANFYMPKPTKMQELSNNLRKIFSIDWESQMHYPTIDSFVL